MSCDSTFELHSVLNKERQTNPSAKYTVATNLPVGYTCMSNTGIPL